MLDFIRQEQGYRGAIVLWTWSLRYPVGCERGADLTIVGHQTASTVRVALLEAIAEERGVRLAIPQRPVGYRFFISHSSADHDFAERLARALVAHGQSVWYDEWELRIGDSLLERI